jgi:hypothetical protein
VELIPYLLLIGALGLGPLVLWIGWAATVGSGGRSD